MNARPITEIAKKRLEKFFELCKQACGSRKNFDKHYTVMKNHVFQRAAETISHLRHTLQNKDNLARVIVSGRLNEEKSNAGNVLEIAIEAKFKELHWVDPGMVKGQMTGIESNVCVRVVIKEDTHSSIKKIIVSVYSDSEIDPQTTPEVQDDIW